jgi:hypothetical protein
MNLGVIMNMKDFSSFIIAKKKTIILFKLGRKSKLSEDTDPPYYIVGQAVNLCTDT